MIITLILYTRRLDHSSAFDHICPKFGMTIRMTTPSVDSPRAVQLCIRRAFRDVRNENGHTFVSLLLPSTLHPTLHLLNSHLDYYILSSDSEKDKIHRVV